MKKLFFLLAFVSIVSMLGAQTVTADLIYLTKDQTVYTYTGTAKDTLNGGTVDIRSYPLMTSLDCGYRIWVEYALNKRAGNDTTVMIDIEGRNSTSEDWTAIKCLDPTDSLSAAVTTTIYGYVMNATDAYTLVSGTQVFTGDSTKFSVTPDACLQYTGAAMTYTFTPTYLTSYYRYLNIKFRILGDDSVGTGVKVVSFTVKLFKKY